MSLHRRIIKTALERETAWTVETHVSGLIDVYPPQSLDPNVALNEVVRIVASVGYEPTVVGTSDDQGRRSIRFHTPETLEQAGEGGHGFRKRSDS